MKVLVLGVTGMLGSTLFRYLSADQNFQVWGTLRHPAGYTHFSNNLHSQLISHIDVLDANDLMSVMEQVRPELVINCVGLIKQLANARDPLTALPVNAMFPHQLAKICALACARLIHISTDCVFSGRKGLYREQDISDAEDLYGKSKFIGELHDVSHAITLRTSIIGHELQSAESLIDWFLSQKELFCQYGHKRARHFRHAISNYCAGRDRVMLALIGELPQHTRFEKVVHDFLTIFLLLNIFITMT